MSLSEASSMPDDGCDKATNDTAPGRQDSKVNHVAAIVAAPDQDTALATSPLQTPAQQRSMTASTTITQHDDPMEIEPRTQKDLPSLHSLLVNITPDRSRHHSPASAGLHIETRDAVTQPFASNHPPPLPIFEIPVDTSCRTMLTSPTTVSAMSSSLRSDLSSHSIASSISPGSTHSALTSPYLAAMADITPLPSPVMGADQSAAPWKRPRGGSNLSNLEDGTRPHRAMSAGSSTLSPTSTSPRKKKTYTSLIPSALSSAAGNASTDNGKNHGRNRSISDFVPEQLQNVRQRNVTLGSGNIAPAEYQMHREANLAAQRGLSTNIGDPTNALPSPPPSNTSVAEDDGGDDDADDDDGEDQEQAGGDPVVYQENGELAEWLYIHCGIHNRRRRFRQLRDLGQGTFSRVILATSERVPPTPTRQLEQQLDQHKLVAIKIVEHGPAGGADQERIEISLRREVEMLKSVSHPSLIHLKACEDQLTRTLLVLTYCPGGDLFELASDRRDILTPALIQRMFAELIDAVRYLHKHWIVHRDIKLENVLVNLRPEQLKHIEDPIRHPTPLITLSDLGLSRRIPQPPESCLLMTRCGSEDYAAPEILLGQPYDGRLTDGWALGVLLYALMEGRLPFDAPPGKPDRSRNTHRIARCDWIWCRFGDDAGEWDPQRGADYDGARLCVEALLKKVRMGRKPLEELESMPWVKQGIQVPGGLQMRAEDTDDL